MFTQEFRERLDLGKYSSWAINLTEDQLEAILWMIGEFGYRAFTILPLLGNERSTEGKGRAVLALEALFRVVGGDRPTRDDYTQRVRTFLAEARGHVEDETAMPAHHWPIEWEGQLVGWLILPELDRFSSCSGVWWPNGEAATSFLAWVAEDPRPEKRLTVGGIRACLNPEPADAMRMSFYMFVNPNHPEQHSPTK